MRRPCGMLRAETAHERARRIAGSGATPEQVANIEAARAAFERDLETEARAWVDEVSRLIKKREPP